MNEWMNGMGDCLDLWRRKDHLGQVSANFYVGTQSKYLVSLYFSIFNIFKFWLSWKAGRSFTLSFQATHQHSWPTRGIRERVEKRDQGPRWFSWLNDRLLVSPRVMISGLQDQAPCRAPPPWPVSWRFSPCAHIPVLTHSLPLSLSLQTNKKFFF